MCNSWNTACAHEVSGMRVLAVHAHPDDEALWTGGALAHLAARGATVLVVTCTLGEMGEVIGTPYQNLVASCADQLGGFRVSELHNSLRILGCRGIFLGAPGRFRDSGMEGSESATDPRAFVNNTDRAIDALGKIMDEFAPHLILTYGPDGGYGHPDHIQAHRITHSAAHRHASRARILWSVTNERTQSHGLAAIKCVPAGWRRARADELSSVPEEDIDISLLLDAQAYAAKVSAMKAHATQLWIADGSISSTNPEPAYAAVVDHECAPYVYALSNLIAQPVTRDECYVIGELGESEHFIRRWRHPLLSTMSSSAEEE